MIRHRCDIADEFFHDGKWLVCVDEQSLIGPDDHQCWVLCQWLSQGLSGDWEPTLDALPIKYCPWCGTHLSPVFPTERS